MKCENCGGPIQLTHFLGWPIAMWYEVQEILLTYTAGKGSPLAKLSLLVEQAESDKERARS